MAERTGAELTHGLSGPRNLRRPARRPGPGSCRVQVISSQQSPAFTPLVERYEAEIAATLIEGALAADELEVQIIRDRLAQTDAGGPFARHEEVLAWLKALSEGKNATAPKATMTF